jgi:hypothetical protein
MVQKLKPKRGLFDHKLLLKDIKRYNLVSAFFVISLVFFFTGIFIEANIMKFAALGLIIFGALSVYFTWVQPSFMSEERIMFNIAVATSHSFFFLAFMLGVLFVLDRFVSPITDMLFALLGAVFLSVMAGCIYLAFKLKDYV